MVPGPQPATASHRHTSPEASIRRRSRRSPTGSNHHIASMPRRDQAGPRSPATKPSARAARIRQARCSGHRRCGGSEATHTRPPADKMTRRRDGRSRTALTGLQHRGRPCIRLIRLLYGVAASSRTGLPGSSGRRTGIAGRQCRRWGVARLTAQAPLLPDSEAATQGPPVSRSSRRRSGSGRNRSRQVCAERLLGVGDHLADLARVRFAADPEDRHHDRLTAARRSPTLSPPYPQPDRASNDHVNSWRRENATATVRAQLLRVSGSRPGTARRSPRRSTSTQFLSIRRNRPQTTRRRQYRHRGLDHGVEDHRRHTSRTRL